MHRNWLKTGLKLPLLYCSNPPCFSPKDAGVCVFLTTCFQENMNHHKTSFKIRLPCCQRRRGETEKEPKCGGAGGLRAALRRDGGNGRRTCPQWVIVHTQAASVVFDVDGTKYVPKESQMRSYIY